MNTLISTLPTVNLTSELNSEDEIYIKRKCRERLDMAGTYIMLIGEDTRYKYTYVKWEAEVAIEKECRIIGVNLDGWRYANLGTCPPVINTIPAVGLVPYSTATNHSIHSLELCAKAI